MPPFNFGEIKIAVDGDTSQARPLPETPFRVLLLGDFSGSGNKTPLPSRKPVQVDRDNFDDVMARVAPELNIRVQNTLAGDGSEMPVQLKFKSMADFEPGQIVQQVPALKKLLETRNQLRDLMTKVDRSTDLENLLESVLKNKEDLEKLSSELGIQPPEEQA